MLPPGQSVSLRDFPRLFRLLAYATSVALVACSRNPDRSAGDSVRQSAGEVPPPPPAAESGAQPPSGAATPATPAAPAAAGQITPAMVALGDSIFMGTAAGGLCMTCHGPDAKGTQLAPNLTDQQWLNGDGSYQFIVTTVTNGVPNPKQYPAPMPPKGGANLTDEQVHAVAAYVYSLTHPDVGR
jgi:mono/diheme cytochrome c family protein